MNQNQSKLMTINALRRPSKSDKIDPRRHPATLAIAHNEAGEGDGHDDSCDIDTYNGDDDKHIQDADDDNDNDDHKHIQDASSKVKTRSGFFSLCSCDTSRLL